MWRHISDNGKFTIANGVATLEWQGQSVSRPMTEQEEQEPWLHGPIRNTLAIRLQDLVDPSLKDQPLTDWGKPKTHTVSQDGVGPSCGD